jgi:hypothetical protein
LEVGVRERTGIAIARGLDRGDRHRPLFVLSFQLETSALGAPAAAGSHAALADVLGPRAKFAKDRSHRAAERGGGGEHDEHRDGAGRVKPAPDRSRHPSASEQRYRTHRARLTSEISDRQASTLSLYRYSLAAHLGRPHAHLRGAIGEAQRDVSSEASRSRQAISGPVLAKRIDPSQNHHAVPMRTRTLALWLRVVLAALIMALGSGAGLPGLVRALASTQSHVCTCASGTSHSACPVCSPSLRDTRSRFPAVDGVPCGERRTANVLGCELGVVPLSSALSVLSFEPANVAREVTLSPDTAFAEPPTPPPRLASA